MPVTSSVDSLRSGGDRVTATQAHPTGTVTFLFKDIEASTRAWGQQVRAMSAGSARHDAIIAEAAAPNGVHVFKTVGDGYCCASLEREASIATEL